MPPLRETVSAVLLDITGVLQESTADGNGVAIRGSVQAVNRLKEHGIPFRLVTNETQKTRQTLVAKLRRLGFDVPEENVFTPALAMAQLIRERRLKPFLVVHPNVLPDFPADAVALNRSGDDESWDAADFDSVVLGDAVDGFSFRNINRAFKVIDKHGGELFALGKGKYYKEDGELTLDVGPFAAALEFATGRPSAVVGKPAADFFCAALSDLGVEAAAAVMVGDDVVSDVGGAQGCGVRGVLVRTGKFKPDDENRRDVRPFVVVDNLAAFVDKLLE